MRQRAFTVGSLIPGSTVPAIQRPQPVVKPIPKKIVIQQGSQKFEISPAKGKLLDVALNQGKPIQYKCRKGTCGQCTVKVLQGPTLSQPNEQEHKKLANALNNGYRLACQAEILQ
ncbi:2Fe-2S iron-sulfur cluster-binding protein [Paenibacillus sp. BSR1-1]|uniref:2Fe-2S iron-sulfur cluster-binding protein n=1 Tax=Paenibacillus sp. BSR1-1 TaxID=3020845 RepID=UPI0025B2459F|nr:2Fe-2S iron-sulfur cluster-binding protein [Paenibacillus sp. BSR1-1]MDN3019733.1 2Fe-2S iron-sulfur cluster-binding protein [Paenibacillus sp. BSR1-1]